MLKKMFLFLLLSFAIITKHSAQLSQKDISGFEELLKQQKHEEALSYIKSLDLKQRPETIEKAHNRLLLSKVYSEKLQFDKAEGILDSLLETNVFSSYPALLAETWFQKGTLARYQNKDAEVVGYFLKVDSIAEQTNLATKLQIQALTTIGGLLFQWRYMKTSSGFSKPSQFYEKALSIAERIGDSTEWYNVKFKLAFMENGNPKKKTQTIPPIFEEAITFFKKNNDINRVMGVYQVFPKIHIIRGNLQEAEMLYLEYIQLAKENDIPYQQAIAKWQYGIMLENSGRTLEAIVAFEDAKMLFESEIPLRSPINYTAVLGELAGLYRKTGRFEEAINQLGQFYQIKDSLDGVAQMENLKELDAKYQTVEKDKEITLLEVENQKKNVQILLVVLSGLLIVAAALFYFYRQRNEIKLAKRISELDGLKRIFFANISHEFRTPLTLIKSPVQQLQARKDENIEPQLNLIDANTNRMLELVDQLLELSKIDSGQLQIILKKSNVCSFLRSLVDPFEFQAKENSIYFETRIKPGDELYFFDKDILTKIVSNLLSNAFKYHEKGTPISFRSFIKDSNLHLEVSNYDSQLKESDLKKMFERFFQKDESNKGAGIGLSLVKDLVVLYEGTITPSLKNGRLTITVVLSLDKNKKNAVVIEENSMDYSMQAAVLENGDELPVILIADDNADIRAVLASIFSSEFVILQAENGREAFNIAQREIPDCIIADVMMPEMDGYLLAGELKENELTATIPVVLLTAKTGDEARLQGLQNSVDAFLTKPFNHEIVKATVSQQLWKRKKMQERYSRELVLKPVDIVINSAEEKFIARLETVLKTELVNPNFTSEAFAEKMYLSRMQLHRKLKMMFGVSATEFIRNERLKVAIGLLDNKLTVSEIAYSIGFNDVGYFSKSFKEMYGVPPSEYQKEA